MENEVRARIESLIDSMSCPKNFRCAEGGFEALCEAKDVGLKRHLKCLDDDPLSCLFAMPMDDVHFCQCPLRVYIAKNLGRQIQGTAESIVTGCPLCQVNLESRQTEELPVFYFPGLIGFRLGPPDIKDWLKSHLVRGGA